MMDGEFSEKLFKRALEKAALGPVSPEDISPLIVFLASPAAKKMTGQRITVNGGIAIS
jgi:NAD(P)-dependent dehydrogenase (short-subunit alcohol dehydrogenase family)